MKKILFALLLLSPALCGAQVAFKFTTAKTYSSATTDTVKFYAPPALSNTDARRPSAFAHLYVRVGNQSVNTDTTDGTTATPPTYVFTSESGFLSTRLVAGTQANSDSTWIRVKPIDAQGRIIHNDSLNVNGTSAIVDSYIGSRAAGFPLNFTAVDAPYGIAIIHQIGGIVAAAIRIEYTVVFRAIIDK